MNGLPANGLSIASIRAGQALAFAQAGQWKHPWQTSPAWSPRLGWYCIINPGFVNEKTPTLSTTIDEQAEADRDFGTNPLTGRPFFESSVFSHNTRAARRVQMDVPLYLSPAIPLQWTAIGFDGPEKSNVPQFFKDRGAADHPKAQAEDGGPVSLAVTDAPPRGLRLLRTCDLVLHQPRLALTSEITTTPGLSLGLGISNVQQTLGIRSEAPGDVLRVFAGVFSPPDSTIDPFAGGFVGVYEEPNYDERLISRVFLLSPPNTAPGSDPDGTWQPFVQHGLFWNLSYRQPILRILRNDPGTPFIPPLAAGAAQVVINFLTASINDATTQALNVLTSHSLAGFFWTPTGGGHDAIFPEELTLQKITGLDKAKRLAAARLAASRARTAARLDPPFPYVARPFDTALLAA